MDILKAMFRLKLNLRDKHTPKEPDRANNNRSNIYIFS